MPLNVVARDLEIQVALDAAHDVVADPAFVSQRVNRAPFGLEQLAAEPLVGQRALLDGAVAPMKRLREAVDPEPIRAAETLRGVLPDPVLLDELVKPGERGFRGLDARLRLFLALEAVLLEPQRADHERQRESLHNQGGEDDAEREVNDQVAVCEASAGMRRQRDRERRRDRDRTAHSGPGDERGLLPRRVWITFAD